MLDEAVPVDAHEAVDLERLRPWLAGALGRPVERLTLGRFPRGYSNLTFHLDADGDDLVLRRGPPGVAIASAHDMLREARFQMALAPHWPLVPAIVGTCDDPDVLGAPFYVMRRLRGIIVRDRLPAGLDPSPATVRRMSTALVDALASLHDVDVQATGLVQLGKPEGYIARQVAGWTKRYDAARTDELADMTALAARLAATLPAETGPAVLHNDLKYDNVVLDPADPGRVIGVLDWEMAAIGCPRMDLGTLLSYWVQADDPPHLHATRLVPTHLPGNLTRDEVVARYVAQRRIPAFDASWYYAFGMFKTAVVAQQLYLRFVRGLTREPRYEAMLQAVKGLGATALRVLDTGRLSGW